MLFLMPPPTHHLSACCCSAFILQPTFTSPQVHCGRSTISHPSPSPGQPAYKQKEAGAWGTQRKSAPRREEVRQTFITKQELWRAYTSPLPSSNPFLTFPICPHSTSPSSPRNSSCWPQAALVTQDRQTRGWLTRWGLRAVSQSAGAASQKGLRNSL